MSNLTIIAYVTGELAVLSIVICIFLFFHIKKLRGVIAACEEKYAELRASMIKVRKEGKRALKKLSEQEQVSPKTFLDFLDDEIDNTRDFHETLNPDRDIVLDISPDTTLERQASALRHAFLIAEKEASYAGEDDRSNWDVLQSKFQQIIEFYMSLEPAVVDELPTKDDTPQEGEVAASDNDDEIAGYKKRIENLEGFKRLFFEMEGKWESSKKAADGYHQQLSELGNDLGANEEYEQLLNNYSEAFNDIGDLLNQNSSDTPVANSSSINMDSKKNESVGSIVIANQNEIQRLKNMAVDQYRLIEELKKKLTSAKTEEETQQVVGELSSQLEKQERYLKEAETCTQLIEDELTRALDENQQLREQLESKEKTSESAMSDDDVENVESVMKDLTGESKDMLVTIAMFEEENAALKAQLEEMGNGSGDNSTLLQEKLDEMQQELLNLQTQHIELEERYLELKMKG
jgi:hypothetical protein